jgi:predicted dehydrogenase
MLRIGVLGAARITPAALIKPAKAEPDVRVAAVAARDPERAMEFAQKHGIPRVHPDYQALVDDPDLDAVYIPLPNGLHGHWTLAALAAGKHVLCEKPLASNATEAAQVAEAAQASGLVVMEAFHYRYHPLFSRALELVRGGELGELQRVHAALCFPLPRFGDIRYRLDLAGGATMDAGCYPVNCVRALAGAEPEVVSARAKLRSPGVDRMLTAELRFPGGVTGAFTGSLWSGRLLSLSASAVGSAGRLKVFNYLAPQLYHRLTVSTPAGTRHERIPGRATYSYQLSAFLAATQGGAPVPTDAADGVRNQAVIDAAYRAAGLAPREPSAP